MVDWAGHPGLASLLSVATLDTGAVAVQLCNHKAVPPVTTCR